MILLNKPEIYKGVLMKHRKNKLFSLAVVALAFTMLVGMCGCGRKVKRQTKQTSETLIGIDVAKYQGTIDWQQVASSDVSFAMIRLGYRAMADGEIKEDSNARFNLQESAKAGIPVGAYFFSTAVSTEEAMEEAAWVSQLVAQYPITYPIVFDCEGYNEPDSRQYPLSKKERTDIALAFLETIEQLGYEAMFYASKNELQDDAQWEVSRIQTDYKIWVAQYPAEPYPQTGQSTYTGVHHMWQYSTEGRIPGITQPVDMNLAYFGYDGLEPAKNQLPPEEVGPDVEALMDFKSVEEQVTAKDQTNLRSLPSQDEDSEILMTLQNGQIAMRIAVSSNGWSKLEFEGNTYYAVSNYLTTNLSYDPMNPPDEPDSDGIQTQFSPVNELVTAKDAVNLRLLPSVEHEGAAVIKKLQHGEIVNRVGISDNGWSKLIWEGKTCYAVSSYLMNAGGQVDTLPDEDGIQTEFEEIDDWITAKIEVNLRTLPSVTDPNSQVVIKLVNGDAVHRTGINRELGWSRVEYNGQILYCVSSYITVTEQGE